MITDVALPAALAFIMFAMGLTLTAGDFRRVAARPRALALGLLSQMVLLPAVAVAAVAGFAPAPEFAVGLMILAACPGGITSNLLTHLAGGATALAVSLTAVTSVAGVVTVPLVVNAALGWFGLPEAQMSVTRMTLGVFAVATLPLVMGMAVNAKAARIASRLEKPARQIATALFAAIVVGAFASQWRVMMDNTAAVLPPALAVNAGAMALAAAVARLGALDGRERIAVVMETGLQNGALGIFVAATLLESQAMMVPSIVYALVMNVSAVAFIAAVRVRRRAAGDTRVRLG